MGNNLKIGDFLISKKDKTTIYLLIKTFDVNNYGEFLYLGDLKNKHVFSSATHKKMWGYENWSIL